MFQQILKGRKEILICAVDWRGEEISCGKVIDLGGLGTLCDNGWFGGRVFKRRMSTAMIFSASITNKYSFIKFFTANILLNQIFGYVTSYSYELI